MAYNPDNEKKEELLTMPKNNRGDYIVVQKVTNVNSGSVSADIRNYYTDKDEQVQPTKMGVRVNSEILLDVLAAAARCLEASEIEDLKDKLDDMLDEASVDDSDVPEE